MKKNAKNAAAETAANAARNTVWAALGCVVLLSTPPKSAEKPYWGVRVQNDKGERYSRTYRCPDLDKAQQLAGQIALDRGLEIKLVSAPEHPVLHPPAQA